jgi:hypothetical protein
MLAKISQRGEHSCYQAMINYFTPISIEILFILYNKYLVSKVIHLLLNLFKLLLLTKHLITNK